VSIGRRSTDCPFKALAPYLALDSQQRAVIQQEILRVLAEPVTDGGRLGWLQMRISHRDGISLGIDALCQRQQQPAQLGLDQAQCLAQAQRVGVIFDIHAGCAQMDDRPANRALLGIGANLSHQVMAQLTFELLGTFPINIILMSAQISELFAAHQSCLGLGLSQRHPDAAP